MADPVFKLDTYGMGERTLTGRLELEEFIETSSQQVTALLRMAMESTAPPEMTVDALAAIADLAFQSQQAIEYLLLKNDEVQS